MLSVCFKCGETIETPETLSIEHKIPWLDNSVELFWDMNNIAFSHLSCNVAGSYKPLKKSPILHGKKSVYKRGCRCKLCVKANTDYTNEWRWKNGKRIKSV